MIDLEVDANDGTPLTTVSAPVDASGNVMFANVPVSAPGVMLHATGQGLCGIGRDALAFAVTGASNGSGSGGGSGSGVPVDTGPCVLTLVPPPEANAFYARAGVAGVLSTRTDPDPATPGYQTMIHVKTAAGWTAELFESLDGAPAVEPAPLGSVVADASGVASQDVTANDGAVGFAAVCHGLHGGLSKSSALHVFVDTTRPACEIVSPPPGATISAATGKQTPTGIQLAFTVHAGDDDVTGEPVGFTLTSNGTTIDGKPPAVRPDGTSTTRLVTLAAGAYAAKLTMRDHAGNVCTADATYHVVP